MGRAYGALVGGAAAAGVAALGLRSASRTLSGPSTATEQSRWLRVNHAGRTVTLAEGPIAAAAVLAGVAVERGLGASNRRSLAIAVAAAGSGLVGAYDDLYGSTQARGFRGHLRALRSGTVTSGMIKIVGVGISAGIAAVIGGRSRPVLNPLEIMVDTTLVAGTANVANLFDLRPGRAAKVVVLLGAGLAGHGSAPAVGAALGCLPTDLSARSMMGDCGANALGAAVATAAAMRLPVPAKLVATAGVVALNLASERISFTAVIERTPALHWVDQLGRSAG